MGGVGKERSLGVDQLLQAVRHLVDRLAERVELSRAAPDRGPLGQTASTDRGNSCLDALQRAGEGSRENRPEARGHGEHADSEEAKRDPVAPDTRVENCRRLGDEEDYVGPVGQRRGATRAWCRDCNGKGHVQEIVVGIVRTLLA